MVPPTCAAWLLVVCSFLFLMYPVAHDRVCKPSTARCVLFASRRHPVSGGIFVIANLLTLFLLYSSVASQPNPTQPNPTQVGSFVFRIYDANDPVETLATSHAWQVDAQGRDVELSLRFVLNQLRSTDGKGSVMGALAQLAHLLDHLQVM